MGTHRWHVPKRCTMRANGTGGMLPRRSDNAAHLRIKREVTNCQGMGWKRTGSQTGRGIVR